MTTQMPIITQDLTAVLAKSAPRGHRGLVVAPEVIYISDDEEPPTKKSKSVQVRAAPLTVLTQPVAAAEQLVAAFMTKGGFGLSDERDTDGRLAFCTTEGGPDQLTLSYTDARAMYDDALLLLSQQQRKDYNLTAARADLPICPDDAEVVDMKMQALDDAHVARARKRRAEDEQVASDLEIAKRALISARDAEILAFVTGPGPGPASSASSASLAKKPKKHKKPTPNQEPVAVAVAHTPATPATALLRLLSSTSPGPESEAAALNFIRLVGPEFETLTIEAFAAQCAAQGGQGIDGRVGVASAVVASRQFGSGGIGVETVVVPDPRFIEALLDALCDITAVDFASSTAMDHAMSGHEQKARVFAAEAFPGLVTPDPMELFAAVTHLHEDAAACRAGCGGIVESKEDLAAAYSTGWVHKAMDRMFIQGAISERSAESVVSAIQAYLGVSGTSRD